MTEKTCASHLLYNHYLSAILIVVVQLLSHVQVFAAPWPVAFQAPLSSTSSQSLLKFMSIELVMLSKCLTALSSIVPFSFSLQPFPPSGSFSMTWLFAWGGLSIGASDSASVLPKNIQGWFPLGLTGLISLQIKGLSRVFSSTIIRKHQFFNTQCSLWSNSHIRTRLLEKP